MSKIRILRPKEQWSISPRNLLPAAVLFRLFNPQANYTVVLDDQPVGQIGKEQAKVFDVEPGEHRLYLRFVGLRRSEELRVSLEADEERHFVCGTSEMGWPTLREASREDVAEL